MMKKAVLGVLVLGLLAGGFFYWWNSQADVRELNKGLPKGVMVIKGLWGDEYRVVNKIDGYEFKVPREWGGVKVVEYTQEWAEKGYRGKGVGVEGKEGVGRIVAVDHYKIDDQNINLEIWAEDLFRVFELSGEFSKDSIENIDIIKTQEKVHLGGDFVYFLKSKDWPRVYAVSGSSEEFIKYIIANGKW